MKWMSAVAVLAILVCRQRAQGAEETVKLVLDPERVLHEIDEKIYGHFLEHIYHSCDGGLWGDLVWNRSFEENNQGFWRVEGDDIVQDGTGDNIRLTFGDAEWRDYEYTVEAKKTGGNEGFLILFRVLNDKDFYWCNLGGWSNVRHALERGRADGGRWGVVGPRVEGKIEEDRWYTIKIRCEGPRFQVWLDEDRIIDFTDDDKAHLSGAVGIGTWSTKAVFRKPRVTSLEGELLYDGIPETLTGPSVARHWTVRGEGEAYVETEDAFNDRCCQRIIAKGGPVALRQKPFRVVAGETYDGSLWGRGQGEIVVRLLDGETVLDEDVLGNAARVWSMLCFQLRSKNAAEDATLEIGVPEGGDVRIDQVSLTPTSWRRRGGFRPDLLDAISGLKPPVIRWPGGCFASAYRWKQGVGPQHERKVHPISIWDQQDVYSFGTDEFVLLCKAVKAEPLIVVNIGTPQWMGQGREKEFEREVLDWLEYCNGPESSKWGSVRAKHGHAQPYGVKYWEIDNETWHMGAEMYSDWVRRLAEVMREKDPSIQLAACGSGGFNLEWNKVLIERTADVIDYLSIHHYHGPDGFADGPIQYEEFIMKTAALIAESKNPDLKIYCSEWNAQSTDWRTGLFCGGLLNAFERCGAIFEMGGPALFLRHVSAAAWDNAFINFDHRTWFPAPNYVVMKLWREHYLPQRVELKGDAGGLNLIGTKSKKGDKLCLKAVNPSNRPVELEIKVEPSFKVGSVTGRQISPGDLKARNTLDAPHAVHPEPLFTAAEGQTIRCHLLGHSAAVLVVE